MNNYFICTKPLQYFNCRNIVQGVFGKNTLVFIPNFIGALDFVNRVISYDNLWDEVLLVNSRDELTERISGTYLKYNVFVDTDLQRSLSSSFFTNARCISVYEEGIGTYSKSTTRVTSKFWKNFLIFIASKFGILNSRMGGNTLTSSIYVYDSKKYLDIHPDLAHKTNDFPLTFVNNYLENKSMFSLVFNTQSIDFPSNENVLIFLTSNSRTIDFENFFESLLKENYQYGKYIFKAHPYVRDLYPDKENFYSDIMSEVILFNLIAKGNKVTVYHYNSSTELYVRHENVSFINLDYS